MMKSMSSRNNISYHPEQSFITTQPPVTSDFVPKLIPVKINFTLKIPSTVELWIFRSPVQASCRSDVFPIAGCIATMTYTMIKSPDGTIYFAYLTYIGVLYSILSVLCTIMVPRSGQPTPDQSVGPRIRLTWILYTVMHFGFVAMLLLWPLVFNPSDTVLLMERWVHVIAHPSWPCFGFYYTFCDWSDLVRFVIAGLHRLVFLQDTEVYGFCGSNGYMPDRR